MLRQTQPSLVKQLTTYKANPPADAGLNEGSESLLLRDADDNDDDSNAEDESIQSDNYLNVNHAALNICFEKCAREIPEMDVITARDHFRWLQRAHKYVFPLFSSNN